MLIVVVLCFVVTELPQGILAFLSGVDEYIFDNVYVPLGDIWDILVLVNSSANFILYCTMSAQYRKTFREDVLRRKKKAQPALEKNRKPGVTAQIWFEGSSLEQVKLDQGWWGSIYFDGLLLFVTWLRYESRLLV